MVMFTFRNTYGCVSCCHIKSLRSLDIRYRTSVEHTSERLLDLESAFGQQHHMAVLKHYVELTNIIVGRPL